MRKTLFSIRRRLLLLLFAAMVCNQGFAYFLIRYHENGGGNPVANPKTFETTDGIITLLDAVRSGAVFQGWYTESTFVNRVTQIDCSNPPQSGAIDLYAKWQFITYHVTYILPAGVTNPAGNPTTFTMEDNITLLLPTRTGYDCIGWRYEFTDANGDHGLTYYDDNVFHRQSCDLTITPLWSPRTCSLTVHCQKGMSTRVHWGGYIRVTDEADNVFTVPYDCTVSFSFDLNETNRDYDFNGIEVTVDGVATDLSEVWENYHYLDVTLEMSGTLTIKGNTVLTYKSTNHVDEIAYSYLPGMIDYCEDDPNEPYGEKCYLITDYWKDPNRLTQTFTCDSDQPVNTIKDLSGWTFGEGEVTWGGWYTDAALTQPIGTPAIPAHVHLMDPASRPHFYAKWLAHIQYFDKGGTAYSGSTTGLPVYDYWCGPDVALPNNVTKTGYTFGGWYDNSECTGDPITVVPDDYAFRRRGSLPAVYANWTAATYSVTLDKGTGGTNDGSATATYDSNTLTSLTHAVKTGSILQGYYTAASGGVKVINADGTLVASVDGYTDASGNWTRSNGSMTLYSQWVEEINYTVEFAMGAHGKTVTATAGGNAITSGASVEAGTEVVLTATSKTFYHFKEWQDGSSAQVSTDNPYIIGSLSGNLNLTAVFERDEVITLVDDKTAGDDWYADYEELVNEVTLASEKVNVRYIRIMNANAWTAFALPFDYSLRATGSVLKGKVYKLGEVIYNTDGMTLNFPPVELKTEANKPYLFYSSTAAENLLFENVTLQSIEDKGYEVENTGNIANSSVYFHATTARTQLDAGKTEAEKKKTIYLNNNRLYHLSLTNASWMRAFRGYFELKTDDLRYIQPRVRIVLGGETVTDSNIANPDNGNSSVIKYVENGILIIEREGVRYNATGARID